MTPEQLRDVITEIHASESHFQRRPELEEGALSLLAHPNDAVVSDAVRLLGLIRATSRWAAIADLSGHVSPAVRSRAGCVLAHFASGKLASKVTPHLRRLLEDPSRGVQMDVLQALIPHRIEELSDVIRSFLRDSEWIFRQQAAMVAGRCGLWEVVPDLEALLNDPVEVVRGFACVSLIAFGATSCRDVALECLKSPDASLRLHIVQAAETHPGWWLGPLVTAALSDGDHEVLASAIEAVHRIKYTPALPRLIELKESGRVGEDQGLLEAIRVLARAKQ